MSEVRAREETARGDACEAEDKLAALIARSREDAAGLERLREERDRLAQSSERLREELDAVRQERADAMVLAAEEAKGLRAAEEVIATLQTAVAVERDLKEHAEAVSAGLAVEVAEGRAESLKLRAEVDGKAVASPVVLSFSMAFRSVS